MFLEELWKGYFDKRTDDFNKLISIIKSIIPDIFNKNNLLEVGCGNGFISAKLSEYFNEVISFDIPFFNLQTHSIGIFEAKKVIEYYNKKNVKILGASGTNIPLKNNTFETTLSMFVLEHIKNREEALKEFYRVLKPNGITVNLVPAWEERIINIPFYYTFILKRTLYKLKKKIIKKKFSTNEANNTSDSNTILKEQVQSYSDFKKYYWNFPFPQPHGEYLSYTEEILKSRRNYWIKLHKNAGFDNIKILTFDKKLNFAKSYLIIAEKK